MIQDSQTAFEIVGRLKEAAKISDILREMRAAGAYFGYDVFIITNLPAEHEVSTQNCALVPSWPEGWRTRYFARDYLRIDPVANHVRRTTEPFLWREAPYRSDEAGAARLMACGWDVEPLGLPTRYEGHSILAVYARLTPDTVAASRRFFGLDAAPLHPPPVPASRLPGPAERRLHA